MIGERVLLISVVPVLAGFALWASKSGGHDRWTLVRPGIYYVETIRPGPLFWLSGLMLVAVFVAWVVAIVKVAVKP